MTTKNRLNNNLIKLYSRAIIGAIGVLLSSCANQAITSSDKHKHQPITLTSIITNFDNETRISDFESSETAFAIPEISNNASGITWDPFSEHYLILQNNSAIIYKFDELFNFLGKTKKVGNINNDTEGLTFIDGKSIMIATEANTLHRIPIGPSVFTRGYFNSNLNLHLAGRQKIKNKGIESVAFRVAGEKRKARFYAAIEGTGRHPEAKMKVMYVDANIQPTFTSNTFRYDEDLTVVEPFNAEKAFSGIITDIAGMTFDPTGETLIIVSQESRKAIQVDPETGEVISQLQLSGAPAYEGVTIGPNGELVFVSERNWVQVYVNKRTLIKK